MADCPDFTWSDTVSGYVTSFDAENRVVYVTTVDNRSFDVELDETTAAEFLRNLGDPYVDASGHLDDLLRPGQYVQIYGIFYPNGDDLLFTAKHVYLQGRATGDYNFEDPKWWTQQIDQLASFYRRAQFGEGQPVDYANYRTMLHLGGSKTGSHVQETDTISRMVYGMASAYMLTGKDEFLEVAEKGTEYLRAHMRAIDDSGVTYWYHGVQIDGATEKKLFTSEFDDDYNAIPMYEQIYALAGPIQTYRVSGDPRILADADGTLALFENYFRDHTGGGYYSHIDPILLSPHHESLGVNASRKNWNSVGDHAPAYLVNLYLATGEERHAEMLERTFDTIAKYFPDYENSPFVNERFNDDWSHDLGHTWQQNRAVVGHNLKIAWNLMRMDSLKHKDSYTDLANKIAGIMPGVGSDQQRGGWYDVMERTLRAGEKRHRFTWHDRKAWWQQEQAILAYLILAGTMGREEYLRHAREAESFYNAFFLDHDEGGVYFNVLSTGMPYLLGTERLKGSHSMSMYHSAELCYLSAVYTNLLITKQPLPLYFKPRPDASRTLRVAPDLLPQGSIRLAEVEIDGKPYGRFDADTLTISLPESNDRLNVRALVVPV